MKRIKHTYSKHVRRNGDQDLVEITEGDQRDALMALRIAGYGVDSRSIMRGQYTGRYSSTHEFAQMLDEEEGLTGSRGMPDTVEGLEEYLFPDSYTAIPATDGDGVHVFFNEKPGVLCQSRSVRSNPRRARRNTAAPVGKGPRILISYEVFTPESVEEGEAEERGWIDEEGVSMRPDKYDQAEGLTVVDEAVKFLRDEGVIEASSSQFHKGIWYIGDTSQNFRTGEDTVNHYHLVDFSQAQEREVYERLFPRRRR